MYNHDGGRTQFGLANRDLEPHPLLVDENFNITALFNLDSIIAAPKSFVACLSIKCFSELDVDSKDLGVRKRMKEYQKVMMDLGHDDLEAQQNSLFGRLVKIVEEQHFYMNHKVVPMMYLYNCLMPEKRAANVV